GGHVAALRLAPVHDGHEAGHRLAALDLLDGSRPRRRRTRRLPPESAQGGERHVKAVVMAGGEGTRLRPLTSNQPKPMVPIVGRACMEHILELLRDHGITSIVATLAYMPQIIRGYFAGGAHLGVELDYSVEEVPAGTAGSVKLCEHFVEDTFLVISGDAITDIDLSGLL